MNGSHHNRPSVLIAALALSAAAIADMAIDWWTIDGGGQGWSTGADWQLSGTIGQPDAGVVMTGGDFELTGGFWVMAVPTAPPLCAGDLNCDGAVDYADIDPFVAALSCLGGDPNCWDPNCPWLNADCNGDSDVTYDDIDPFVARIGATCP